MILKTNYEQIRPSKTLAVQCQMPAQLRLPTGGVAAKNTDTTTNSTTDDNNIKKQLVVLEHYPAGLPATLSSTPPNGYTEYYEVLNDNNNNNQNIINYMKAFLDTAEQQHKQHKQQQQQPQQQCNKSKYFVKKTVSRWYCLDTIQPGNCTVYSFGIVARQEEWEFDDFFHNYGCTVYSYYNNPSNNNSNGLKKHKRAENHYVDNSIGIGVSDGLVRNKGGGEEYQVRTLKSLMKENGDSHIDILRLDMEGAEWELLGSFIEQGIFEKSLIRGFFSLELHMWQHLGYHEYFFHYLSGIPMKLIWKSQNMDPFNKETKKLLSPNVTRVYEVLFGHFD